MRKRKSIIESFKYRYSDRKKVRSMYDENKRGIFSNEELSRIRKGYLKDFWFFLVLLLIAVLALIGNSFIDQKIKESDNQSYLQSTKTYKSEEDVLAERLNRIYGSDRWTFGIYQTELDAYRVEIKLSDGSVTEKYYQVSGQNIYELTIED